MSSILREVVGAVCCCFSAPVAESHKTGISRDLKRLSDWRAHPTLRQYELEKHIADGGFSEIWLARERGIGKEQVLKVVYLRKPGLRPEDAEVLRGEARLLRNMDHPGILGCKDVFETKYHQVMILEYLSGGEMLQHLHQVAHYSEAEAGWLFAQVVSAVAYLHNLNIVHRDIKPENIMFARRVEDCLAAGRPLRIKLIDLGMATVLPPSDEDDENSSGDSEPSPPGPSSPHGHGSSEKLQLHAEEGTLRPVPHPAGSSAEAKQRLLGEGQRQGQRRTPSAPVRPVPCGCMGSPGFIAPEVVNGAAHSFAMDVYSLGVLLFIMLTGRKPWPLRDVRSLEYARKSLTEAPGLKDPSFLALSPPARDLLRSMLADDPRDRPSARATLKHPFLLRTIEAARTGGTAQQSLPPPLDDAIRRRIAQLASLRRFRGLAFAMMSSRQEGQQLSDFLKFVTERRQAVHRDIVTRARVRRSVERQRRSSQELQLAEAQRTVRQGNWNAPAAGSRHHSTAQAAPASGVPGTVDQRPSPAGLAKRISADSTSSQRPLLQPGLDTHRMLRTPQPEFSRRSAESVASTASSREPLLPSGPEGDEDGSLQALPSHHPYHSAHASGATLVGGNLLTPGVLGLPLRHPVPTKLLQNIQHYQLHHHHYPPPPLDPVAEPGEGTSSEKSAPAGSSKLKLPPVLSSTAGPPNAEDGGTVGSTGLPGRGRGWSTSGCRGDLLSQHATQPDRSRARQGHRTTAPAEAQGPVRQSGFGPPHQAETQQKPKGSGLRKHGRGSELELAALDPLALIRELPGCPGGVLLGRAHSAPESMVASRLMLRGSDGGGARLHLGGAGGPAGSGEGGRAADERDAAWLDRLAMGADMRAFSASSWTLDLLANGELLAALTGLNLAARASSSNYEGTVYDNSVYDGMGYGGSTSTVSAAAGQRSGDMVPDASRSRQDVASLGSDAHSAVPQPVNGSSVASAAATAAAAAAAFRRLQSDVSNRGVRTSSAALDATVHAATQAAALLAAVGSGRPSAEGWQSAAAAAHAAAAAAASASAAARTRAAARDGDKSTCAPQTRNPVASAAHPDARGPASVADTPTQASAANVIPGSASSRVGSRERVWNGASGFYSLSPFATPGAWASWQQQALPGGVGSFGHADSLSQAAAGTNVASSSRALIMEASSSGSARGMDIGGSSHLSTPGAGEEAEGSVGAVARYLAPFLLHGALTGMTSSSSGGQIDAGYLAAASGTMVEGKADVDNQQPIPLLRAARLEAPGDLYGLIDFAPLVVAYKMPVSPLQISASSQGLLALASGVGPSPGTGSLTAFGSDGAGARAGGLCGSPWSGGVRLVAAAGSGTAFSDPPAPLRRPSLALIHKEEHIAAQRASLEETLHGGDLWFRRLATAASGRASWSGAAPPVVHTGSPSGCDPTGGSGAPFVPVLSGGGPDPAVVERTSQGDRSTAPVEAAAVRNESSQRGKAIGRAPEASASGTGAARSTARHLPCPPHSVFAPVGDLAPSKDHAM